MNLTHMPALLPTIHLFIFKPAALWQPMLWQPEHMNFKKGFKFQLNLPWMTARSDLNFLRNDGQPHQIILYIKSEVGKTSI